MPAKTATRPRNGAASNATSEDRRYLQQYGDNLSRSVQRAKWVHPPEERADRAGQTLATREHDVIKAWAESRHAKPTTVRSTRKRPRVLRFDFEGQGEEAGEGRFEHIPWQTFFEVFDERELVMLFQERLKNGRVSNFARFNSPHLPD